MSEENDKDLELTKDLYALLQGTVPDGCQIDPSHVPNLTPDQAWTVVWWLGNQYRQVSDAVEKCDVCGEIYHSWQEGECMDFGSAPYYFCGNCCDGEDARIKRRIGTRLERSKLRQRAAGARSRQGEETCEQSRAASPSDPSSATGAGRNLPKAK